MTGCKRPRKMKSLSKRTEHKLNTCRKTASPVVKICKPRKIQLYKTGDTPNSCKNVTTSELTAMHTGNNIHIYNGLAHICPHPYIHKPRKVQLYKIECDGNPKVTPRSSPDRVQITCLPSITRLFSNTSNVTSLTTESSLLDGKPKVNMKPNIEIHSLWRKPLKIQLKMTGCDLVNQNTHMHLSTHISKKPLKVQLNLTGCDVNHIFNTTQHNRLVSHTLLVY